MVAIFQLPRQPTPFVKFVKFVKFVVAKFVVAKFVVAPFVSFAQFVVALLFERS